MNCYVITGFCRSGTSLTAGICRNLGLDIGNSFQEPDILNATGYWEDRPLLGAAQGWIKLDGWTTVRKECEDPDHYLANLRDRITDRRKTGKDWGFKNNWISLIAKEFLDNCPDTVYGIFVCRNIHASARSYVILRDYLDLRMKTGISKEEAMAKINKDRRIEQEEIDRAFAAINHHNRHLQEFRALLDGRTIYISYENLIEKPQQTIKSLADFLSLPINEAAINLVNKDLRTF